MSYSVLHILSCFCVLYYAAIISSNKPFHVLFYILLCLMPYCCNALWQASKTITKDDPPSYISQSYSEGKLETENTHTSYRSQTYVLTCPPTPDRMRVNIHTHSSSHPPSLLSYRPSYPPSLSPSYIPSYPPSHPPPSPLLSSSILTLPPSFPCKHPHRQ